MRLRLFIFLFIFQFSSQANAYYMSLGSSYDTLENPVLSGVGASLSGFSPFISIGFDKTKFKMPIELFFSQTKANGTINHDDNDRDVLLKQTVYGIKTNLIINSRLYLIVGYAISQNEFEFNNESSLTQAGIRDAYDFNDGEASGFLYGLGLNVLKGKKSNMFAEYRLNSFSENKVSTSSFGIGFRYKF